MLDLETLGHRPGSVIVAIGAVEFGGGEIRREFYERIHVQSCMDAGLKLDASTVLWWMRQSEAARRELLNQERMDLPGALLAFTRFVQGEPAGKVDVEMWGNGPGFDNELLVAAYEACGTAVPWTPWQDRCYRTLRALRPHIPFARPEIAHHALHDARAQAIHLMKVEAALVAEPKKMLDELEAAWGLLANVGGGIWLKESPEWQKAAGQWRHRYGAILAAPSQSKPS